MARRKDSRDLLGAQLQGYSGELHATPQPQPATASAPAPAEAPARPARPAREDASPSVWPRASMVFWGVLGALLLAGWITGAMGLPVSERFRAATAAGACTVTGCSTPALVLAGFVLALPPLLYALVLALCWGRSRRPVRVASIVAGLVLVVVGSHFTTVGSEPRPEDLLPAPGGAALLKGLLAGTGSLLVALFILLVLQFSANRWRVPVWAGALLLLVPVAAVGSLSWASARQDTGPRLTSQIFPGATFQGKQKVAGRARSYARNVLTRTSAADIVGCGDRWAGCLRTAEFEFTIRDSDAIVRFEVVSFPDNSTAWDARAGLGDETGDPSTIRLSSVTNQWLLVSTVRHADRRPIRPDEQKWLRWPAKQLEYGFGEAVGYVRSVPESSATTAPRTS